MRPKHENHGEILPGPGAYEPKHSYDASYNVAPAYS